MSSRITRTPVRRIDAPIGERQKSCLDALKRHGRWPGPWYYDNASTTRRILDSLVTRGLVTCDDAGTYRLRKHA